MSFVGVSSRPTRCVLVQLANLALSLAHSFLGSLARSLSLSLTLSLFVVSRLSGRGLLGLVRRNAKVMNELGHSVTIEI